MSKYKLAREQILMTDE